MQKTCPIFCHLSHPNFSSFKILSFPGHRKRRPLKSANGALGRPTFDLENWRPGQEHTRNRCQFRFKQEHQWNTCTFKLNIQHNMEILHTSNS